MVATAANEIWQAGVRRELRQESRRRWLKRAAVLGAMLALGTVVFEARQAHSEEPKPPSYSWINPHKCGKTRAVIEQLTNKYKERPLHAIVLDDGTVAQIWGQLRGDIAGGRSWTIVRHTPTGISCAILAGKHLPQWVVDELTEGA